MRNQEQSYMTSRPDTLAKQMLDRGKLRVDTASGAITRPNGQRAEVLDKRMGYGRIAVYSKPLTWAMAHRVVWIAANGLIPDGLQINHRNRLRWDNRIDNLELVAVTGNQRHWRGMGYDRIGQHAESLDVDWLNRLDKGNPEPDVAAIYTQTIEYRRGHRVL
jgi:hypothetical protein